MADPIDLNTLSDEQLAMYRELVAAKAMKDPANAPGQLPDTIPTDEQGRSRIPLGVRSIGVPPPAPNVYPEYTDPKDIWYNGTTRKELATMGRFPGQGIPTTLQAMGTPPDELRPNPNDDAATARKRSFALQKWVADNASNRQWGESAGAATLFGGGPVVQLLNAATTRTPVDLLTLGALHGGGKALDALQFANRTGNTATGAVKGVAQYEAGSRLHAFLNGDKQPENDPRKRNPLDLLFEGGAGLLGGLAGYKSAPVPEDKRALAQKLFDEWREQKNNASNQIKDIAVADTDAEAMEKAAERALEDAKLKLLRHKELIRATEQNAVGKTNKEFHDQAAALRVQEQSLSDQVEAAEEAHTRAVNAVSEHQQKIQGVNKFSGNITANTLSDQILEHSNQLDAWNAKAPPAASAPTAEELDLSDKIKAIQEGLDGGTWRGPVKALKARQLKSYQTTLEGYETARTTPDAEALDAHNAEGASLRQELRKLKDQRSRVLGGRTVETDPTDIAEMHDALARKTAEENSAATALNEIRTRFNASRIARLSHAGGPTAPTGSLDLVQREQQLTDAVDHATEAVRQAGDVRQGHRRQTAVLNAVVEKLTNSPVPEPKPTATDAAKKWFKAGALPIASMIPAVSQAVAYHHVPDMGRIVAATVGPSLSAMAHTEWGSKLLKFLYNNMASKGPQAIPALVNHGSRLPRDNQ